MKTAKEKILVHIDTNIKKYKELASDAKSAAEYSLAKHVVFDFEDVKKEIQDIFNKAK